MQYFYALRDTNSLARVMKLIFFTIVLGQQLVILEATPGGALGTLWGLGDWTWVACMQDSVPYPLY